MALCSEPIRKCLVMSPIRFIHPPCSSVHPVEPLFPVHTDQPSFSLSSPPCPHVHQIFDSSQKLSLNQKMCMTLLLNEPMSRAITTGYCKLEWSNFTECVVTYVVTRTRARFGGVISTAVLSYIDVSQDTRLSIYVPHLCLGLLVMMLNGWLLVSLQGESPQRRATPFSKLFSSLTAAYCLHGALTVYVMTSLIASALAPNPLHRNRSFECLITNSLTITTLISALFHHLVIAFDRTYQATRFISYRTFWSTSYRSCAPPLIVWTLSIVLGFLPIFGWRTDFRYCIFFYLYKKTYFVILAAIFVFSLLVMAAMHSFVVLTARKPTSMTLNMKSSRSRRRLEARYTSTAAILSVVAAILWTPLYLHLVLACPECSARSDNDYVLIGVFALALANGLVSPVVFAFCVKRMCQQVRSTCRQWGVCNVKRRSGTFELRAQLSNSNGNAVSMLARKQVHSRRTSLMDNSNVYRNPSTIHGSSSRFPNGDMLY